VRVNANRVPWFRELMLSSNIWRDYEWVGAVILGEAFDHNEARNAVLVRTDPVVMSSRLAEVTCPGAARPGGGASGSPDRVSGT
jgi:hypothetical protein